MVDISWTEAARPGLAWLKRRLPAVLFRHFYAQGDLEEDIKVFCDAQDSPEVYLPKLLQAPTLSFSVSVLNTSPYLDVRLSAVHCLLVANSGGFFGNPFATYDRWSGPDLPRGLTIPININFLLNEFQLQIVQKYLGGEAWIRASLVVWLETKIGPVHVSKCFNLARPHTR